MEMGNYAITLKRKRRALGKNRQQQKQFFKGNQSFFT